MTQRVTDPVCTLPHYPHSVQNYTTARYQRRRRAFKKGIYVAVRADSRVTYLRTILQSRHPQHPPTAT